MDVYESKRLANHENIFMINNQPRTNIINTVNFVYIKGTIAGNFQVEQVRSISILELQKLMKFNLNPLTILLIL